MELFSVFIIPLSLGILGYLTKTIIDLILNKRDRTFKLYERQLSEFYWPIYIRHCKSNSLRIRMLSKGKQFKKLDNKIASTIEEKVIMQNNQEIVDIIMSKIFISFPDKELLQATRAFLRHVEIYKAIRIANILDKYPSDFNAEYPTIFGEIIEKRTLLLQNKINKQYNNKIKLIPKTVRSIDIIPKSDKYIQSRKNVISNED
jgi:hypothetical protein